MESNGKEPQSRRHAASQLIYATPPPSDNLHYTVRRQTNQMSAQLASSFSERGDAGRALTEPRVTVGSCMSCNCGINDCTSADQHTVQYQPAPRYDLHEVLDNIIQFYSAHVQSTCQNNPVILYKLPENIIQFCNRLQSLQSSYLSTVLQ